MNDNASRTVLPVACACALVLALLVTSPLAGAANDKSKGKGGQGGGKVLVEGTAPGRSQAGTSDEKLLERGVDILVDVLFTDHERRVIRESFGAGYPAGFEKPKPIPPGIRKKLARGGTLPPGIAKTRLPASVYERLPHRKGEEIVIIDRDVYLIRKTTQLILDVLEHVL